MRKHIFLILCVLFILFSLSPSIYEISRTNKLPEMRQFELIHNYITDYNFYLSRIREGLEGNLLVQEKYTSEPHAGSLIHEFYLVLGLFGKILGVPPGRPDIVYHAARIIFGLFSLLVIAEFCKKIFLRISGTNENFYPSSVAGSTTSKAGSFKASEAGKNFIRSQNSVYLFTIIAYLLAVTASSWPFLIVYHGYWRLGGFMSWWSLMDTLQRLTFVPHLVAGATLMMYLVLHLGDRELLHDPKNWLKYGVVGIMLGIILPQALAFTYGVLGILIILEIITLFKTHDLKSKEQWFNPVILSRVIFGLISAPSIIYLFLMLSIYPWKRITDGATVDRMVFSYLEYFKAVGPVLPLGIIGLIVAIWKWQKEMFIPVSWVITWLALLFYTKFSLTETPLRFTEMLPHVPLGVLTAYLFWSLTTIKLQRNLSKVVYLISITIPALVVASGLGLMCTSILWQKEFVDQKVPAGYPLYYENNYIIYPLKDFISAMRYLEKNSNHNQIVLSLYAAGNYLPAVSGNTVYLGQQNTVNLEQKKVLAGEFFSGQMKDEVKFIQQNQISFVYDGPEEQKLHDYKKLSGFYPNLREIFSNDYVVIYKIINN